MHNVHVLSYIVPTTCNNNHTCTGQFMNMVILLGQGGLNQPNEAISKLIQYTHYGCTTQETPTQLQPQEAWWAGWRQAKLNRHHK